MNYFIIKLYMTAYIYYWTNSLLQIKPEIVICPEEVITTDHIKKYYRQVYKMAIPNNINLDNEEHVNQYLEEIFKLFNDNDNNPLNDDFSQGYIVDFDSHTSMSIGDIIALNHKLYLVCSAGFNELH